MNEPMRLLRRTADGHGRLALTDAGGLLEYYLDEGGAGSLVGAVFLGTVERVLPDVGAAFVKLGLERNGFLPLREADSFHQLAGDAPLRTGQELLVQVKKDPKGEKGAFLTRDIALPGQYVLYMPANRFVGVSKRVTDEGERARAAALGRELGAGDCGLIVRHAALFASRADIADELEALRARWQALADVSAARRAPALLYREPGMVMVLARDYAARHPLEVFSDVSQPEGFPENVPWHVLTEPEMDARWRAARVESALSEALERRVNLPGGGTIVIDEREALQTIDVNSGRAVKLSDSGMVTARTARDDGMELAFESNLAAVGMIARQIRLRNLSGIILIDFIDMRSENEREMLKAALETALEDDRVKSVVHGFTSLGLLELTRKRTDESLRDKLTVPCPTCGERGRIPEQKKGKR